MGTRFLPALFLVLLVLGFGAGISLQLLGVSKGSRPEPVREDIPARCR
ncbi:APOC2 isoform 2 [Pongo abelii]|uniref:APOC2 isoform 2 n=1 Tax=Pongo abelii TaxID=9601 RepID=A0A2J8RTS5_PONAB|nr:APOC2 isoform 2 [Pongo abelii]